MVLHFNGRYRTATECHFLEQVENELAKFQKTCKPSRVLVFPPLSAHYRFLIHQLVGVGSRLQTVSVGEGQQRRTVVYFATARAVPMMAESPSTSQRTFFGRGRGRRTRRPDQQLYVPGALRQSRCEQQEQKLVKEVAVKREENETLSTDSAAYEDALSRSTAEEFGNCHMSDKQRDESKNVANDIHGTERVSSDVQNKDINFTLIQGISCEILLRDDNQREGKDLKNEVVTTIVGDSTMSSCENAPREKHESSSFVNQFLNTESSGNKFDDIKDKGAINGTESLQISSKCVARDDRAAENSSLDVNENCRISNKKSCNETESMTEQIQCERASNENLRSELNQRQDDSLLEEKKDLMVREKEIQHKENKSKVSKDGEVKHGNSSEVSAIADSNDSGIANVRIDKSCTEFKSVTNRESTDALMVSSSYAVDCKGEKIQNKINCPGSVQQYALSSVTQEYTESAAAQTGRLLETSDGITLSEDDSLSDQHRFVNSYQQDASENADRNCEESALAISDLMGSYSLRTCAEEVTDNAELGKSQAKYRSAGKDTVNFANDRDTGSENTHPKCSVSISGEVETQRCDFGVSNLDKIGDELEGTKLEVIRDNIEARSDKVEGGSDPISVKLSQTSDELQTETPKKKKSKKDKTKDKKDGKPKCKEKGEKKKKKEKKCEKTEKGDKDTEEKATRERKLKAKVLSDKKQDEKDLNTCDRDTKEELSTSTKAAERFHSYSDDDGGGDSDNWESFFDESGDCLNPEHLKELSRLTGIAKPEVQKTQFDFYSFTPRDVELDDEEFGHIVEIYNFSPDLKTQDLMQALSMFRGKGFDIKWVDDTHALGIFSSHIAAQEAIRLCSSPLMKLRPISQGTPESRRKATNSFEFFQPYKERPQTSKLLADRLVTGALGMRSKMTREDRVKEREKLKEAKNKKQQEKVLKAQIWGD